MVEIESRELICTPDTKRELDMKEPSREKRYSATRNNIPVACYEPACCLNKKEYVIIGRVGRHDGSSRLSIGA